MSSWISSKKSSSSSECYSKISRWSKKAGNNQRWIEVLGKMMAIMTHDFKEGKERQAYKKCYKLYKEISDKEVKKVLQPWMKKLGPLKGTKPKKGVKLGQATRAVKSIEIGLAEHYTHPWSNRITDKNKAFSIGGQPGGQIHLNRGSTYTFHFKEPSSHHFMFTLDPVGGRVAGNGGYTAEPLADTPSPQRSGSFELHVGEKLPKTFYYQSREHPHSGGLVVVHDS